MSFHARSILMALVVVGALVIALIPQSPVAAAPAGYVSQSSPTQQQCLNRPAHVICFGFDDGFIWWVEDFVGGCNWTWNENAGTWAGKTIQVITDCAGKTYKHIMGTTYVSTSSGPKPNFSDSPVSQQSATFARAATALEQQTARQIEAAVGCGVEIVGTVYPPAKIAGLMLSLSTATSEQEAAAAFALWLYGLAPSSTAVTLGLACASTIDATIEQLNALIPCFQEPMCSDLILQRIGIRR